MFLPERKMSFLLYALAKGRPTDVSNSNSFPNTYFVYMDEDKNLPCELYHHDLMLFPNTKWNPNPFLGDTQ